MFEQNHPSHAEFWAEAESLGRLTAAVERCAPLGYSTNRLALTEMSAVFVRRVETAGYESPALVSHMRVTASYTAWLTGQVRERQDEAAPYLDRLCVAEAVRNPGVIQNRHAEAPE